MSRVFDEIKKYRDKNYKLAKMKGWSDPYGLGEPDYERGRRKSRKRAHKRNPYRI